MPFQHHADSEYVSYVEVDRKDVAFIGNKQTNKFTRTHTNTRLYILVQVQM